ncbi:mitotic spindle checkpoint protein MAD1 isoform X2 [Elaeis guineensis]|uniref:Mitotic spindle checkpoint protein MAD1 isoform X1 n=2 Tax=Elaeis guineensis var. tenera TaxID=51953 RepID=A0A6I9QLJ0_ELAGV|nr:mitotic spindle checkpoint protein MAD1 isoform X1 [Elaeis guineensis]
MILRTPPPRKRRAGSVADHESPVSDRRLVLYDDPIPVPSVDPLPDQMVCTYHCRQMVKSEFVVALDTAEKQVHGYQAQLETLKTELHVSEDERKKCQDRLRYLEQELEASKGREHALQERLIKEVNDSQGRYQLQVKRCSELEVQLKKEVDSRKNSESSAASAKERATDLEEKLQRLSESSEREKNRLQRELAHWQDDSKLSVSRKTADLERMRLKAENLEEESELLKKQLKEIREQLDECLHQKSALECKLSTIPTPSESTPSEDKNLVKHLREELRNYEAEVQEARRLKSCHMNNELLKEKLLEEKGRREKAEIELSQLQEAQLNAQNLELELMSWKSLLKEIPDVTSYDDIPKKIAGLQKEAIESLIKVGEISAHLKELEVSLELAELCKQHAEKESLLAKEKAENSALEVKRLELMLSSVAEERDRLNKDAIALNKQKTAHADSGMMDETLVKDLESSLALRKQTIKELESNLHEQREVINRQYDEIKLLNEKLSFEARRIKSLEREGDRLRSEIALLESKLGHGDYSVANTKVLRMVNTLAVDSETKQTIEALQAELKKTQAKLQAVEELKGQSDAGNVIDVDISEKLAQLKGQIAILEKREERYKAVFAERISVFRRACCSLFGYKIVMDDQQRPNGIPVTRFTLQSIYAQSDDEKLEFEYESGNTNILVNDYSSQPEISQQIEIFIKKMNSIPAFTANLTMESFNKRTLS